MYGLYSKEANTEIVLGDQNNNINEIGQQMTLILDPLV